MPWALSENTKSYWNHSVKQDQLQGCWKDKKSSTFPQKFLTRQDGAGLQAEAANPEGPASPKVSFTLFGKVLKKLLWVKTGGGIRHEQNH